MKYKIYVKNYDNFINVNIKVFFSENALIFNLIFVNVDKFNLHKNP